ELAICKPLSDATIVSGLGKPEDIVTDGLHIYWTDLADDTIWRAALDGSGALPIAAGQYHPLRIAVDDQYVYWSNNWGGAVMRLRKATGASPQVVAAATSPTDIAADPFALYWIESQRVMVFNKADTFPQEVQARFPGEQGDPYSLALTTTHIIVEL